MKITDLEQFALEQVYRPYQGTLMGWNRAVMEHLTDEYNLENALAHLKKKENKDWSELVLDRIIKCRFYFPPYIRHDLVDYIKEKMEIELSK
jgi:hypothetical protein